MSPDHILRWLVKQLPRYGSFPHTESETFPLPLEVECWTDDSPLCRCYLFTVLNSGLLFSCSQPSQQLLSPCTWRSVCAAAGAGDAAVTVSGACVFTLDRTVPADQGCVLATDCLGPFIPQSFWSWSCSRDKIQVCHLLSLHGQRRCHLFQFLARLFSDSTD